jgi:hypothetical protein
MYANFLAASIGKIIGRACIQICMLLQGKYCYSESKTGPKNKLRIRTGGCLTLRAHTADITV